MCGYVVFQSLLAASVCCLNGTSVDLRFSLCTMQTFSNMHFTIDQPQEESHLVKTRLVSHVNLLKESASTSMGSSTSFHHRTVTGPKPSQQFCNLNKDKMPFDNLSSEAASMQSLSALRIQQPRKHQASILLWTDLSISSMDRLNESASSDHVKQVLADIFVLDNYRTDPKSAIVMDLFFHTLQFAKQEQFSREKTSAFFSIIKRIFEMSIESPFTNSDITHDYFKDLLVCHSVQRPPYSVALFSASDVMKISQHTMNTFFRHFEMYKCAFTPQVSLDLKLKYFELPPTPPPQAVDKDNDENEESSEDKSKITEGTFGKNASEYLDTLQDEFTAKEIHEFMHTERKKIHDKISAHMNRAVDVIYTKVNQMLAANTLSDDDRKNYKLDV